MNPAIMCDRHLLGEHNEHHAMLGTMRKRMKIDNYIAWNLFNPGTLAGRHESIKIEMLARNFNHDTPINIAEAAGMAAIYGNHPIDIRLSNLELLRRCPECRKRFYGRLGEYIKLAKEEQPRHAQDTTIMLDYALALMNDDYATGLAVTDFLVANKRLTLVLQDECYDPKPANRTRYAARQVA
jgi:hypothetical protein